MKEVLSADSIIEEEIHMAGKNIMSHKRIALFGLIFLLLFSFLQATQVDVTTKIRSFEELEKAIVQAKAEVQANPENVGAYSHLGQLLFMGGKYPDAEIALNQALGLYKRHLPSLVTLADLLRRSYRFEEGEEVLKRALGVASDKVDVKLLEAKFKIDRMDFESAQNIYKNILEKNLVPAEALCGLAELFYWLNRYEDAERFIQECLHLDPDLAQAYVIQSRIHRTRQENEKWIEWGRTAVEIDPFNDDARANLANILFRGEGKLKEGYEQAKIALRINPYSRLARFYLANGWTPHYYEEHEIEGDQEIVKKIQELLKKADDHLLEREFSKADRAFSEVLEFMPKNITAMIGRGTVNYHQQNYDTALSWFSKVLEVNPDYGLAHYGISQTLLRIKDRANARFDEIEKAFASRYAKEPPYMKDVYINYEKLDQDLQKILRISVEPLRNYLKALKIAGATFYLTPFHKLLWEAPYNESLKGQRTFDLRLWDDVKGNGGFHATSGEDWERDVKHLRFNVVAHEFAHQVHPFLSKKHQEEIKWLFLKAKKERKTLDFYADFNEWEYFAVGVEAYVSEEKLADQKIGYGHTRRELLEKDPDLYYFIESLANLDSYEESEILAMVRKVMSIAREEGQEKAVENLEVAIEEYGNHPEFHEAMASVYRLNKEYERMKEVCIEAVHEFPDDSRGYIGLADIYFTIERETAKAIKFLEESVEKYPNAVDLLVKLGELYYFAADVDKAAEVLQKALSIDPFPDPYASSDPYYYLAKCYVEKEEYSKAEKFLDFSLAELDKNNLRVRAERAYVALKMGKTNEGQEHLDLALNLRGRYPRVQEIRAMFLAGQGNIKEARKLLEELIEKHPERLETKIQLAQLIMESEPAKAREILDEVMAIVYPKDKDQLEATAAQASQTTDQILVSRLHTVYGLLEESMGEIESAINHHQKAWDLFKYNYASAVALVKLYKKSGNVEAASEIYQKLKKMNVPKKYLMKCEKYLESVDKLFFVNHVY
jgi:tetratricopeptide (TPR) repeat protein